MNSKTTDKQIERLGYLIKRGVGLEGICRIMKKSRQWVRYWSKKRFSVEYPKQFYLCKSHRCKRDLTPEEEGRLQALKMTLRRHANAG